MTETWALGLGLASLGFLFLVLSLVKTALRSLSKVTLRRLAEVAAPRTRALLSQFLDDPTDFILNLQSLIQVSLVALAVLVTTRLAGFPLAGPVAASLALLTLMVLIFEHFFPRFVMSVDRERLLTHLLPAYGVVAPLARAVSWPMARVYRMILGSPPGVTGSGEVSDEEVRAFIDVGEEAGILDETEGKIVESIVDFSETIVREVMTPRVDVVSIEASKTVAELRDLMLESRHSRLPIFRDRMDNVEGVVFIKDVLEAWRDGREADKISVWTKPCLYVPETKSVSSLLKEFQRNGVTFAVVVDEFGGISGLVTVEDLIEEIVGEIKQPDEDGQAEVVRQADGSYLLSGKASIHKLDELFGVSIEEAGFDTLAGLVFATLGRVPAAGEELVYEGLRLKVVDADRHRLNQVQAWLLEDSR